MANRDQTPTILPPLVSVLDVYVDSIVDDKVERAIHKADRIALKEVAPRSPTAPDHSTPKESFSSPRSQSRNSRKLPTQTQSASKRPWTHKGESRIQSASKSPIPDIILRDEYIERLRHDDHEAQPKLKDNFFHPIPGPSTEVCLAVIKSHE